MVWLGISSTLVLPRSSKIIHFSLSLGHGRVGGLLRGRGGEAPLDGQGVTASASATSSRTRILWATTTAYYTNNITSSQLFCTSAGGKRGKKKEVENFLPVSFGVSGKQQLMLISIEQSIRIIKCILHRVDKVVLGGGYSDDLLSLLDGVHLEGALGDAPGEPETECCLLTGVQELGQCV